MRVFLEERGDWEDVLVVELDDGTELSAWCTSDDPEIDLQEMENTILACINEALRKVVKGSVR
jgi:hypothetical protein